MKINHGNTLFVKHSLRWTKDTEYNIEKVLLGFIFRPPLEPVPTAEDLAMVLESIFLSAQCQQGVAGGC